MNDLLSQVNLSDLNDAAARAARLALLYREARRRLEQARRRGNVDPATLERWAANLADLGARWSQAQVEADAAARSAAIAAGRPVQPPLPGFRGPDRGGRGHRR
jgi:anti-sigma-K factor RskA